MRRSKKGLAASAVVVFGLGIGLVEGQATAGPSDSSANDAGTISVDVTRAEQRATEEYWTPQRRANATPMDAGYVVDEGDLGDTAATSAPESPPGYSSSSRPMGKDGALKQVQQGDSVDSALIGEPQHGTKPTNPQTGPYGPFQRWSLRGRYTAYPATTVGKLFFTLNGGNFVCSASTYQQTNIVTAGHCVSDGTSTFATSVQFCPAYNAGGPNPNYGCWNWSGATTSAPWHFNGDPDYDYARIGLVSNGGVCGCPVGNAVGWLGVGWNWGTNQPDMSIGYPQAAPFAGNRLIQTASTDWYTHDFTSGNQVSKVMGNDMTGGSSGGPWVLGWRHVNAEIADTDGSSGTDPGGPFVNGVNSHKRCVTSCQSPPTSTNGVFWQEMTSPPFEDTSDTSDVRAVLGV